MNVRCEICNKSEKKYVCSKCVQFLTEPSPRNYLVNQKLKVLIEDVDKSIQSKKNEKREENKNNLKLILQNKQKKLEELQIEKQRLEREYEENNRKYNRVYNKLFLEVKNLIFLRDIDSSLNTEESDLFKIKINVDDYFNNVEIIRIGQKSIQVEKGFFLKREADKSQNLDSVNQVFYKILFFTNYLQKLFQISNFKIIFNENNLFEYDLPVAHNNRGNFFLKSIKDFNQVNLKFLENFLEVLYSYFGKQYSRNFVSNFSNKIKVKQIFN